ncbi:MULTISPECIES: DUF2484 family protein [Salipiger]|uniref:DUF2484 family protein n=1 Tax=Salipiger TaxID=263377 RepID=UPI003515A791
MPVSLMLACAWGIVANLAAMLPSRDNHWTRAYLLIASGLPILGYVVWECGPWVGLVVLLAMMSVLRWPVLYLWRWLRRRSRPGA